MTLETFDRFSLEREKEKGWGGGDVEKVRKAQKFGPVLGVPFSPSNRLNRIFLPFKYFRSGVVRL